MRKRIAKAFTLIELLVVIAIIGVLTGFVFVSMNGSVNAAKDARRQVDVSTISKAIMAYIAVNNTYPYTGTSTCNICNNDSCTNPCTGLYANIQPYLSNIPLDPDGSTYYTYTYSATPKFVVQSTLSNAYTYQYDSTAGFSNFHYTSTCTATTNAKVSCTVITISSAEEVCQCLYLSGDGSTTWMTPSGVTQIQYLVVAGGGGGGNSAGAGGGGGAGGLLTGTLSSLPSTLAITVGAGGASAYSGSNSVLGSLTAIGGGAGGVYAGEASEVYSGANGGSGGGGAHSWFAAGGSGTAGQGNAGGAGWQKNASPSPLVGGGGGGAGGAGANGAEGGYAGNGGPGYQSSITGTALYYAGGGGGGCYTGAAVGIGGSSIGGNGGMNADGTSAVANTGSGGGGAGYSSKTPGAGSAGVVIIRYTHP